MRNGTAGAVRDIAGIDCPLDAQPMPTQPPLPSELAAPPSLTAASRSLKKVWPALALALGLALAGMVVGYGVGKGLRLAGGGAPPAWSLSGTEPLWVGLAVVLGLWAVLAVHELGHLLGGMSAGWKPALLCVGPLRLDFGPRGVRTSFNRSLGTWGGLAASVPPVGMAHPQGLARMVAGGPLASLLLALLAGALAFASQGLWSLGWGLLSFASGAIVLATLIPTHLGGFRSDGAQLLAVWRRDPAVAERLALSTLWTQSVAGVRPRDWDRAAIEAASAAKNDPQVRLLGALMLAQASLDRRDMDAAHRDFTAYARLLHQGGLACMAAPLRPALQLPVVVYLGQFLRDAAAARAWLLASPGGMSEAHAQAHARAAVALAEGHATLARREAEAALALGPKSQDPGAWAAAQDDLQALLRALPAG